MQKFLSQFKPHLTPMLYVQMESRVFTTADRFVEGYNGGTWPSFKTPNGAWSLAVPSKDGRVHIVSPMNGADVTTDVKSAGIALSILVVSWTWELLDEVLTDSGSVKFAQVREQLLKAAESGQFDYESIRAIID